MNKRSSTLSLTLILDNKIFRSINKTSLLLSRRFFLISIVFMSFQLYLLITFLSFSMKFNFFPKESLNISSLLMDLIILIHHLLILYVSNLSFGLKLYSDLLIFFFFSYAFICLPSILFPSKVIINK